MAGSPTRDLGRYYIMRNNMEERELKTRLAKLDGEKLESLHRLQRRQDCFSEGHSKHMFSLQYDRLHSRKRWIKKDEGGTRDKLKVLTSDSGHHDRLVTSQLKPQIHEEQTPSNSQTKFPVLTKGENKFPLYCKTVTKSACRSGILEEDVTNDVDIKQENNSLLWRQSGPTKRSKAALQSMDVLGGKLKTFRQLSHRVRKLSTWCYLLRNVFDRLSSDGDHVGGDGSHVCSDVGHEGRIGDPGKSGLFEELRTCRYLRLPPYYELEEDFQETCNGSNGTATGDKHNQ